MVYYQYHCFSIPKVEASLRMPFAVMVRCPMTSLKHFPVATRHSNQTYTWQTAMRTYEVRHKTGLQFSYLFWFHLISGVDAIQLGYDVLGGGLNDAPWRHSKMATCETTLNRCSARTLDDVIWKVNDTMRWFCQSHTCVSNTVVFQISYSFGDTKSTQTLYNILAVCINLCGDASWADHLTFTNVLGKLPAVLGVWTS